MLHTCNNRPATSMREQGRSRTESILLCSWQMHSASALANFQNGHLFAARHFAAQSFKVRQLLPSSTAVGLCTAATSTLSAWLYYASE